MYVNTKGRWVKGVRSISCSQPSQTLGQVHVSTLQAQKALAVRCGLDNTRSEMTEAWTGYKELAGLQS